MLTNNSVYDIIKLPVRDERDDSKKKVRGEYFGKLLSSHRAMAESENFTSATTRRFKKLKEKNESFPEGEENEKI